MNLRYPLRVRPDPSLQPTRSGLRPSHAVELKRQATRRNPHPPSTEMETSMPDLTRVFAELRSVMAPFAAKLDTKQDDDSVLYVDTRHIQKNKKPMYFGAVTLRKSYVSYHLMPVYVKPALLDGVSASLKSRMQGKSCFNFSEVDKPLFKELAALTKAGYQSYQEQGFV